MLYWKTGNLLLRSIYPGRLWKIPTRDKKIYLSFDDGPHPRITPYVLDLLLQYNAKACFFCIGKNVEAYPGVYERILNEGHSTGNHTMNHLNGWKVKDKLYFENIDAARQLIDSRLFRPPYGRLTGFQAKLLKQLDFEIVMWTVLSGDFDSSRSGQDCWKNVEKNAGAGSIILYHDSEKAWDRLTYSLPRTLEYFTNKGFTFESIRMDSSRAIKPQ